MVVATAIWIQRAFSYLPDNLDDWVNIATIVAIVIGGFWTYLLFVRRRQIYPRANLSHQITHRPVSDEKTLLTVSLTVFNEGEVLLSLTEGFTRIQQMFPLADEELQRAIQAGRDPVKEGYTEIEWPQLHKRFLRFEPKEREIEPGEKDDFYFDFIVDGEVKTIIAYTYLKNQKKRGREIGWGITSVYDLQLSS